MIAVLILQSFYSNIDTSAIVLCIVQYMCMYVPKAKIILNDWYLNFIVFFHIP